MWASFFVLPNTDIDINKMKKYHNVGIVPNFNIRIVETGPIDTPNTQIHDRSHFLLGTGHFNEKWRN